MSKYDVIVIDEYDDKKFENKCKNLLNKCYEMKACSCAVVQLEEYDFCSSYKAIFVKKNFKRQNKEKQEKK